MGDDDPVCPYCGSEDIFQRFGLWRCGDCLAEFDEPVTRWEFSLTGGRKERPQ
jgi:ribosomal protein L37AE/L43A